MPDFISCQNGGNIGISRYVVTKCPCCNHVNIIILDLNHEKQVTLVAYHIGLDKAGVDVEELHRGIFALGGFDIYTYNHSIT
jgi:hypothetical protein